MTYEKLLIALFAIIAILWTGAVYAQPAPTMPDPKLAALGQMLQEGQQREALALIRAVSAEQRAAMLDEKVKALTAAPSDEKPKDAAP